MRLAIVSITLLSACKDSSPKPPPQPVKVADAAITDAPDDWTVACEAALTAKLAPVRKLEAVIEGCRPCGDWTPILQWTKPATEGGPSDAAIEYAMNACNAWCTGNAKMQFLGLLGDARVKGSLKPWRTLGEICKGAVSAEPDERFMSAPYFALDRIARATADHPRLAPLAAALDVPLPPVSITGVGFELAKAAVTKPDVGKFHVTVSQLEIRAGTLPSGKLGKGITVELGATPYPGELVTEKDLAKKLDALTGSPTARVTIIAATGVPAQRVVDVVKSAGAHELVLAVSTTGGPHGWALPGVVPVVLDAKPQPKAVDWPLGEDADAAIGDLKTKPADAFVAPTITIGPKAKVTDLAKLLGALAFREAHSASLVKHR